MSAADPYSVHLTIQDQVLNPIDRRLFGQFLERASFGEPGPECIADPMTGKLPAEVVARMLALSIPVMRFPGGTDIDYQDWRSLIDGVPGVGPRPATQAGHTDQVIGTRFGIDEWFRLRDTLKCQTILVTNLLDGLARRRPLAEAALIAAGLVAYANAPLGAKLPEGMPDWPAIRAANGHPEPWGCEYVQLGNEWFLARFRNVVKEAAGIDEGEDLARWYAEVIRAYLHAIRAVDAKIPVIIDALAHTGADELLYADPVIRAEVAYGSLHIYAPGNATDEHLAEATETSVADPLARWRAWTAMPGAYDQDGQCIGFTDASIARVTQRGMQVVVTEWNWNGWGHKGLEQLADWRIASGLGAAGFLNGMLRRGREIDLATQSMLVGKGWGLAAIGVVPDGSRGPESRPTGLVTGLYSRYAGDRRLASTLSGVPTWNQPWRIGWARPAETVAALDVVVTADDERIVLHLVNRDPERAALVSTDVSALVPGGAQARCHQLVETEKPSLEAMRVVDRSCPVTDGRSLIEIPARSMVVVEIDRP